jgi:hypothetical protein
MFGYLKNQLEGLSKRNKARDQDKTLLKLLDELLDITDEVKMLNEIKDVHDELEMILHVFDSQLEVLQQMNTLLTYRERPVAPHILKKWTKIMDRIERRREKVQAMDHNAHRTYKSINNLFNIKQRQANVLKAHYSRKVAQDSGRQATTIMIFTTVSVIFLPLSFISSFYALSIKEFPRDPDNQNQLYMSLSYVGLRVIGIGLAIAAMLVLVAFGLNGLINRYPAMSPFTVRQPSPAAPESSTSSLNRGGVSITPLRMSKGPLDLAASLASQNIIRQRKHVEPYGSSIFSFDSYSPSPVKKAATSSSKSSALAARFWAKSPSPMGLQSDGAAADDEGEEREKWGVRSWDVGDGSGKKRWGWRPGGGKDGRVFTAPA